MAFTDLRVPKVVCCGRTGVCVTYILAIQDMYDEVITDARTPIGERFSFKDRVMSNL